MYAVGVASHGITYVPSFVKVYQLFRTHVHARTHTQRT